jgi:hypothetical protein
MVACVIVAVFCNLVPAVLLILTVRMQTRDSESAHRHKNNSIQQVVIFLIIVRLSADTPSCIPCVKLYEILLLNSRLNKIHVLSPNE